MYEIPAFLNYPFFVPYDLSIKGTFCYIIEHYGMNGLAVLISRDSSKENVVVKFGDWDGNVIDIKSKDGFYDKLADTFLTKYFSPFLSIMATINLQQAQFYFAASDELMLVDIHLAANKMASPGFVRDMFSNICTTQIVKKIEIIDDRVIEQIESNSGSYSGNLIIKPSKFRMCDHDGVYRPLYMEKLNA
jgi:hypothetical protein